MLHVPETCSDSLLLSYVTCGHSLLLFCTLPQLVRDCRVQSLASVSWLGKQGNKAQREQRWQIGWVPSRDIWNVPTQGNIWACISYNSAGSSLQVLQTQGQTDGLGGDSVLLWGPYHQRLRGRSPGDCRRVSELLPRCRHPTQTFMGWAGQRGLALMVWNV